MNNNFDLDERILAMTREELHEEVADQIQCIRELMSLHRKEELILRQKNETLREALDRMTTNCNNSTKIISVWRTSCYFLTVILVMVAISLTIK